MTRSKLGIALLVFAATAAAQTNTWELGHPDAKLMLGIDVKSIRESDAWKLFSDPTKAPAFALQPPCKRCRPWAWEYSIKSTTYLCPRPPTRRRTRRPMPRSCWPSKANSRMDALKAFQQSAPRRYRTADLYRTTKTDTTTLAVMDGLLLLGDEKSVLSALDRRGHALPPASKLLARAKALAATHDFWIIADESLSKFQPASAASEPD